MDENDYVSIPVTRDTVQQVIDGKRASHPKVPRVRENDYVEFFSAPPIQGDTSEPHPEPDSMRVLVAGTKLTGGVLGDRCFTWKATVPCETPGRDRSHDEEKFDILCVVQRLSEAVPTFIPAFIVSKATGLPLREVSDHFELLADDGFVKLDLGLSATLSAKGRKFIKEKKMVLAIGGGPYPYTGPVGHPVGITESLARFKRDHPDPKKAAFIMMRFGKTSAHDKIVGAVRAALKPHGILGMRADEREYDPHLFQNIQTYMHGCGFGIAVFERIETEDFNANVSLEVGYMIALNKPVCLLKDSTLRILHTDLGGMIARPFETPAPDDRIAPELGRWLSDKGLVGS